MTTAGDQGFKDFFRNFQKYLGIILVMYVSMLIYIVISAPSGDCCFGLAFGLAPLVFASWCDMAFYASCGYRVIHRQSLSSWRAFTTNIKSLFKFCILLAVIKIIQSVGLALFVIPGLVAAVYLVFAEIIFVVEKAGIDTSLNQSVRIARQYPDLFGITIVAYLPVGLISVWLKVFDLIPIDNEWLNLAIILISFFVMISAYFLGHSIMIHVYEALRNYSGAALANEAAAAKPLAPPAIANKPITPK
ncbi:MAG TPA: YciC family protein [bacterium]|nr:YciC family protein [bacterium]